MFASVTTGVATVEESSEDVADKVGFAEVAEDYYFEAAVVDAGVGGQGEGISPVGTVGNEDDEGLDADSTLVQDEGDAALAEFEESCEGVPEAYILSAVYFVEDREEGCI